jgi:transcriptional regulator with XRE-family HTH domain
MDEFAEALREIRTSRGLTQARLSELLAVSPSWETGAAAPRLDTLVKIADILDVTLDELVGRTEPSSDFGIQNPSSTSSTTRSTASPTKTSSPRHSARLAHQAVADGPRPRLLDAKKPGPRKGPGSSLPDAPAYLLQHLVEPPIRSRVDGEVTDA